MDTVPQDNLSHVEAQLYDGKHPLAEQAAADGSDTPSPEVPSWTILFTPADQNEYSIALRKKLLAMSQLGLVVARALVCSLYPSPVLICLCNV